MLYVKGVYTVQFIAIQYIIKNFKSQFNYHDHHINIKLFTKNSQNNIYLCKLNGKKKKLKNQADIKTGSKD